MSGGQEKVCSFCHRGTDLEDKCGPLLSSPSCSAHKKCMQYSSNLSQYTFESFGGFDIDEVEGEIKRGKKLKCSICLGKRGKKESTLPQLYGATAGCSISTCKKSFHFYCANTNSSRITKRIRTKQGVILYRTFCSQEHYDTYSAAADSQQDDEDDLEEFRGEPIENYLSEDEDKTSNHRDHADDHTEEEPGGFNELSELASTDLPEIVPDRHMSPGPLSPILDLPGPDLSEPAKEAESLKRLNPDCLPDIVNSPRKRVRVAEGSNETSSTLSSTSDVESTPVLATYVASSQKTNTCIDETTTPPVLASAQKANICTNDDITPVLAPHVTAPPIINKYTNETPPNAGEGDAKRVTVKQEPVENEVSSTSQRDAASHSKRRTSMACSDTMESVDPEGDGWKKKVCALCFTDKCDLGADGITAVKSSVYKTMNVEEESIVFWSDIADRRMYWKEDTYMRYFMLDIVKAVHDEKYTRLHHLLLYPDDQLEQYKGQHSFTCQFVGDILECLKKILQTQIDHYAEEVNWKETLAKTLVLDQRGVGKSLIFVLILNNTTDADCTLRKNFSKKFVLHLLNPECELKSFDLPVLRREELKQREISTLRSWLKAKTNQNYEVHRYPTEEMLLVVDDSVAWQLSQELIIGSTGHANCDIVFFRAINTKIINHKEYCHQVMRLRYQQLTRPKKVYFVFDVCGENLYSNWNDLVPHDLKKDVLVWSCFDPSRFPVTCVVVYMIKEEEKEEEESEPVVGKTRRLTRRSNQLST